MFTAADLPPGVKTVPAVQTPRGHTFPVGPTLFATFHPDGQLFQFFQARDGLYLGHLELAPGDTVATLHSREFVGMRYGPQTQVEHFSAWDDDSKPFPVSMDFPDWVRAKIRELSAHK